MDHMAFNPHHLKLTKSYPLYLMWFTAVTITLATLIIITTNNV